MPLISNVGKRSPRVRILLGSLYLILCIGGLTMLYPFALMVANSITSYADYHEFKLVPRYLYSGKMLFKKYICDKTRTNFLGYEYGYPWYHPVDIKVDAEVVDVQKSELDREKTNSSGKTVYRKKVMRLDDPLGAYYGKNQDELERIVSDWKEFFSKCPDLYKFSYFTDAGGWEYTILDLRMEYRLWLERKYKTVDAMNKAYTDNAEQFKQISPPVEDPMRQRWVLPLDKKYLDWIEFKKTLPFYQVRVVSAELAFQKFLVEKYPFIADLSKASGINLEKHSDLTLSRAYRDHLLPQKTITEFVKKKCPVIFLEISQDSEAKFRSFIDDKYKNFSAELREQKRKIKFSRICPMDTDYSGQANEWIEFMEKDVPLSDIGFRDPTLMYQNFLIAKFGTVEKLNAQYGLDYRDFADIRIPAPWIDTYAFREHKSSLFWKYLTGNYTMVFNVIAVHGKALSNTLIFICLSILCALTINPLAAYALSRYKLRYTNKILLFLLATMAFPHSVGMIPSFLLLKDLGLLNTFAALVLPGLANGYSIFLLKGFFDSLPSELYEASLIDGASELMIFWKMALPMTKPILAIMALGAFTHAYSAFMFAFLTCQDPQMWTLMVFLYEFQQNYANYMVMASLVISAVPTYFVFVFCQNIIMRGIVVPSFK